MHGWIESVSVGDWSDGYTLAARLYVLSSSHLVITVRPLFFSF